MLSNDMYSILSILLSAGIIVYNGKYIPLIVVVCALLVLAIVGKG